MKPEQLLVGESDVIVKLRKDLPKFALRKDNLLIEGERGTGKTTVARILLMLSPPRGEMVEINPHGAGDIAVGKALGRIGEAALLLIPDIGEFSFLHQSMIASSIRPQAGKRGPRVIATVTGGLDELVESKKMLRDLAAMVDQFSHVGIPPLSRRVNDIPLLADAFARNAAAAANRAPVVIETGTADFLRRRTWKGNVRELKFVVERAVMESAGGVLELPTDLVDEATQLRGILSNIGDGKRFSFDKSLLNLEKTLLERTLAEVSLNQSRAAEILNLSEANLRYRMKKFKIRG
ncbi:MAG TPA: helix-turn-helix domain-containing protein [Bacteroidota bacterium]|nr:helix-turn-helix domain-containing protein [Bacteroidota bacterium]